MVRSRILKPVPIFRSLSSLSQSWFNRSTLSYRAKLILAFAAVYIIWGSTFYGVHIALESFPPFLLSSLRMIIAGGTLAIYCVITRQTPATFNDIVKHATW